MAVFVHGCLLIIESLLLIFVFWKINSRAVVCDPAHQVVGVEIAEPSRLSCICSSTDSIFPQRCAQCLFCQTGRIIWDRNPPPPPGRATAAAVHSGAEGPRPPQLAHGVLLLEPERAGERGLDVPPPRQGVPAGHRPAASPRGGDPRAGCVRRGTKAGRVDRG